MNLNDYFDRIDSVLSRTVLTGKADTATSPLKSKLMAGDDLLEKCRSNRSQVASYVQSRASRVPRRDGEFLGCLLTIGEIYAQDVFPASIFREWELPWNGPFSNICPHAVPVCEIWNELLRLDRWLLENIRNGLTREVVAQLEWEIGIGPIHPFYDSCGRISRYAATLVRCWAGIGLPVHKSRALYMTAATEGVAGFQDYQRSLEMAIPDCDESVVTVP